MLHLPSPRRARAVALFASLLASGCAGSEARRPVQPTAPDDAPKSMTPEDPNLPTPYTADEIKRASKTGRTLEFLVETPPKPPTRRRMVFLDVTDVGAMIESTNLDRDGVQDGEKQLSQATWEELRKHALYPRANTQVTTRREDTPAGSFDCTCYTVERGPEKTTACFAKTLPGPPVVMTTEVGGDITSTISLLSHKEGS